MARGRKQVSTMEKKSNLSSSVVIEQARRKNSQEVTTTDVNGIVKNNATAIGAMNRNGGLKMSNTQAKHKS